MKRVITLLGLLATATVCAPASAADFVETRTVNFIVIVNPAASPAKDWFSLTGLTQLTGCNTFQGNVVIKLPDKSTAEYKAMLAALQAAKLAARQVKVTIRNNLITDTFCTAAVVQF